MNLHALLLARETQGRPLRVGLIGAGKFGSMFLAQALRTRGLHLLGVADLSPARARAALGARRLAGGAYRRQKPRRGGRSRAPPGSATTPWR